MDIQKKNKKAQVEAPGALSPLDEIRQEEAKIASQLFLVRQEVEAMRKTAAEQAAEMKEKASQSGLQEGQAARESHVRFALTEAEAEIAQAKTNAEKLFRQEQVRVEAAAQWAINVILGLNQEGRPS